MTRIRKVEKFVLYNGVWEGDVINRMVLEGIPERGAEFTSRCILNRERSGTKRMLCVCGLWIHVCSQASDLIRLSILMMECIAT